MPLFEWSDEFSVGVSGMDRHHQKIFDMLNNLHEAMLQGKAMDMMGDIIKELLDYTKYHFAEEEKLMERVSYVGLAEQRNAHAKFISLIEGYKEQADKGMGAFLSSGVSTLLTDWLKTHIGVMDKKYQDAMNAGGIR